MSDDVELLKRVYDLAMPLSWPTISLLKTFRCIGSFRDVHEREIEPCLMSTSAG
jgi:hypothetical protein